jgi:hypothetical protein
MIAKNTANRLKDFLGITQRYAAGEMDSARVLVDGH